MSCYLVTVAEDTEEITITEGSSCSTSIYENSTIRLTGSGGFTRFTINSDYEKNWHNNSGDLTITASLPEGVDSKYNIESYEWINEDDTNIIYSGSDANSLTISFAADEIKTVTYTVSIKTSPKDGTSNMLTVPSRTFTIKNDSQKPEIKINNTSHCGNGTGPSITVTDKGAGLNNIIYSDNRSHNNTVPLSSSNTLTKDITYNFTYTADASYTITATDKAENSATATGTYTIAAKPTVDIEVKNEGNNTITNGQTSQSKVNFKLKNPDFKSCEPGTLAYCVGSSTDTTCSSWTTINKDQVISLDKTGKFNIIYRAKNSGGLENIYTFTVSVDILDCYVSPTNNTWTNNASTASFSYGCTNQTDCRVNDTSNSRITFTPTASIKTTTLGSYTIKNSTSSMTCAGGTKDVYYDKDAPTISNVKFEKNGAYYKISGTVQDYLSGLSSVTICYKEVGTTTENCNQYYGFTSGTTSSISVSRDSISLVDDKTYNAYIKSSDVAGNSATSTSVQINTTTKYNLSLKYGTAYSSSSYTSEISYEGCGENCKTYSVADDTTVYIKADTRSGYNFNKWETNYDSSETISFGNKSSNQTSLKMPKHNLTVEAKYSAASYTLKVYYGIACSDSSCNNELSGSSITYGKQYSVTAGTKVYLKANNKPDNVFTNWNTTGLSTSDLYVNYFTMPSNDVSATAKYKVNQVTLKMYDSKAYSSSSYSSSTELTNKVDNGGGIIRYTVSPGDIVYIKPDFDYSYFSYWTSLPVVSCFGNTRSVETTVTIPDNVTELTVYAKSKSNGSSSKPKVQVMVSVGLAYKDSSYSTELPKTTDNPGCKIYQAEQDSTIYLETGIDHANRVTYSGITLGILPFQGWVRNTDSGVTYLGNKYSMQMSYKLEKNNEEFSPWYNADGREFYLIGMNTYSKTGDLKCGSWSK